MKLINISEMQTGLVLVRKRADAKDSDTNEYRMLTLKSFEPQGWINENKIDVFFSNEELENKYLTNKVDIIIRLTTPYTAICMNDKQEEPVDMDAVKQNIANIKKELAEVEVKMEKQLEELEL